MTKICILTAGKGSRLNKLGKTINKAILPIKEKAILSHILELFDSKDEFVIGLGYRGSDVKNYLKIAHPNLKFKFVEIENFAGKGSGPGRSLLYCKKFLQEKFFFVPCDLFSNIDLKHNKKFKHNIFWCSKTVKKYSQNYLNFFQKKMSILNFADKKKINSDNYYSWSGLCFIKDYKKFWNSLENRKNKIKNEYQISNGITDLIKEKKCKIRKIKWVDLGNYKNYEIEKNKYQKFDFSKDKEFIYFVNSNVIKFSKNEKDAKNKYLKFKLNKKNYPIDTNYKENYLFYKFQNGKNYYNSINKKNFIQLLNYLDKNLWKKKNVSIKQLKLNCTNFYKKKTYNRTALFLKTMSKYDKVTMVNNLKIESVNKILNKIKWNELLKGTPSYIHGDLQFDNIIKTQKSFKLIDWRSDFDGQVSYGDINYDYAKMLGGIHINYKEIKKNNFLVKKKQINKSYFVKFPKCKDYKNINKIMNQFLYKKKIDPKKIETLQALIYLNMSPLHKPPFSIGLFLYAKYLLTKKMIA